MFVRDIDSDASHRGFLLGIEMEGDFLGLRAGYLNVALILIAIVQCDSAGLATPMPRQLLVCRLRLLGERFCVHVIKSLSRFAGRQQPAGTRSALSNNPVY